jgi:hypothetical protein
MSEVISSANHSGHSVVKSGGISGKLIIPMNSDDYGKSGEVFSLSAQFSSQILIPYQELFFS